MNARTRFRKARIFDASGKPPFDGEVVVEDERIVYAKGALEKLLPACRAMLADDGSEVALDAAAVESAARDLAARGLRTAAG